MPVIAVTAEVFEENRAACRKAGMDDFIEKPLKARNPSCGRRQAHRQGRASPHLHLIPAILDPRPPNHLICSCNQSPPLPPCSPSPCCWSLLQARRPRHGARLSRRRVLIGPWGLGVVHDPENLLHTAELGVVLLLFIIGLELQPSRLWALRKPVFGLGGLQFFGVGALLIGVATCSVWTGRSPFSSA